MKKIVLFILLLVIISNCNYKPQKPVSYSDLEIFKMQVDDDLNIHHLSRFPLIIQNIESKEDITTTIWIDFMSLYRAQNMYIISRYEFKDSLYSMFEKKEPLHVDSILFERLKKDYTLQIDNEVDSIYQKEGFDGVFSKYVEFDKELYFPMVKAKNEKQFSYLQYIFYQHKILTTYYDECYELGYVIYLINGDIYDRCVRIHPEVKLAFEKGSIIDE